VPVFQHWQSFSVTFHFVCSIPVQNDHHLVLKYYATVGLQLQHSGYFSPENYLRQIQCVSKNIQDIFDSNLNKNYQILILCGLTFLTQLAIKLLFNFLPHPMSVSALPRKTRLSEICAETYQKREKKHSQHYWSKLEALLSDLNNFWLNYFEHNWLLNDSFKFPPHLMFASALLREIWLSKARVEMNEKRR